MAEAVEIIIIAVLTLVSPSTRARAAGPIF